MWFIKSYNVKIAALWIPISLSYTAELPFFVNVNSLHLLLLLDILSFKDQLIKRLRYSEELSLTLSFPTMTGAIRARYHQHI